MEDKKIATALKYDENIDKAPKLLAKGTGYVAENIIKVGKENNASIYEDEQLARKLNSLEVGTYIPEDLYEIVAEVLIFISNMDKTYEKN